ncbi:GmrSD restriction endonuclease domain-containing protein [Kineococcus sp. SYSU DK018]|uniref:GmrSD restriction endonuclease domain-containing protein n=1 Tax=Kineococcus sp. SYSU DK018 TaxID=3383139 RepID=UPI003D7E72FE
MKPSSPLPGPDLGREATTAAAPPATARSATVRPATLRWAAAGRRWHRAGRALLSAAALTLVVACAPGPEQPQEAVGASTSSAPAFPVPAASTATAPSASLPVPTNTAQGGPARADTAQAGTALALLDTLEVKGRAPKTGYSREAFGDGWVDTDHNGCDTRNDVLARDLTGETFKPGTRDCVVATGTLDDPYSGTTITFTRGQDTSSDVQIDHVVALSDAWQKGAQQWDEATRVAFANDGLELLAVDGPLNGQKGDGDAATWLPPNRAYRCTYVARQVAIKATWGLWVTTAEKDAIAAVLATCPQQPVPTTVTAPAQPTADVLETAPADEAVSYANCDAVRAAGADPIRTGEPGYSRQLDRDGDGIGCE